MKNLKIGVYQICKNEINYIKKWYDSINDEQDGIFVTDTGSTDGTLELLKSLPKVIVFEQKIIPWRFDKQRNIQLSNVPEDFDVVLSSDMDETMEQGWRNLIQQNWDGSLNCLWFTCINHIHSRDKRNEIIETNDIIERIHRRHNQYWKYPVHEIIKYEKRSDINNNYYKYIPSIICYHYPDASKTKNYLSLIVDSINSIEFKDDSYLQFRLAKEYDWHFDYENAREQYYKFLQLTYIPDNNQQDLVEVYRRIESMNNIQRSILNENTNKSEENLIVQLQWILKQLGEYPYAIQNWDLQQQLWKSLNNNAMVYQYCRYQQLLYNSSKNFQIVSIDSILELMENQKKQLL